MKKIIFIITVLSSVITYSQVKLQSPPQSSISNANPFLDASNFSTFNNNVGKGLYFPKTDLTAWEFKTDQISPGNFSTYFDGMIVYNVGEGLTNSDSSKGGIQVTVEKGFYYFYNPNQTFPTGTIAGGKWVKLGEGATPAGGFWSLTGNGGIQPISESDVTTISANPSDPNVKPTYAIDPQALANKNFLGTKDENNVMVVTNNIARLEIGKKEGVTVGAGTFNFVLDVYGKARFRDGIVTSNSTYPDYVFDNYFTGTSTENPDYTFKKLDEVETFIKENRHLPGVTSIDELNKVDGAYEVDNAALAIQTLEKVEELYLHVIEQQKEIEALKAEIANMKK